MKIPLISTVSLLAILVGSAVSARGETFVTTWKLDGDLTVFNGSPVDGVTVSDLTDLEPDLAGGSIEPGATTLEMNRGGAAGDGLNAWSFRNEAGTDGAFFLGFTVTNETGKPLAVESLSLDQAKGNLLAFQLYDENGGALTETINSIPANGEVENQLITPYVIPSGESATFRVDFNSGTVDSVHLIDLIRVRGTVGE